MAGFNNDVVFGKNGDFSAANNASPSESNGLVTDGKLWIGSTSTNAGGSHVKVGTITSPDSSITLGYSSPNITAIVNRSALTDLHTARYIVSAGGAADGANYTTITSAIAAASSAGGKQTIFIQPGTYTENFSLVAGVNIAAYECDPHTPNVTIIGKISYAAAGTVTLSGLRLQTNADYALAVTGSAASIVRLINCFINCANFSGINFTTASASSQIYLNYCSGDLTTTGVALFIHSGTGNIFIKYSLFGNSGSSTTNNTCSGGGGVYPNYSAWSNGTTLSSSSAMVGDFLDLTMAGNQTALTTSGTASFNIQHCTINGNTSSAISLGVGTSGQLHECLIASSNANAIAGSGTLLYTHLGFNSVPTIQGTVVQSSNAMMNVNTVSTSSLQPAFLATHSVAQTNVTGNGAQVAVNFTTEVFDQASNYDGTNTFTAPYTGRYLFNMSLNINDAATATAGYGIINTSNRAYVGIGTPLVTNGNLFQLTLTVLADMDAADTCACQGLAQGLAGNTADFPASVTNTFFGGYLVC